jgi:glutaredoxin
MNQLYRSMAIEQARGQVAITMYMARWCRACSAAGAWLRKEGIAYREVDIDAGPASAAELRARNPAGGIPTIDIDGQVLVGFSATRIQQAIDRAAERRAGPAL